ncbi:potassium channel family protein [Deinococcus sp. Marseille-Q6407]|uniref:potassium channel family protein n=1 Tax=Deinococcus sp. Marseille-Q6407 TaxID=2969223 RepID=UPI0021BFE051|nr:potassium channel protein [Deinococcus sp. Marseille-Q6407]
MFRFSALYLLLIVAGLVGLGTAGYHLIEGYSLLDSLYMTMMVLTTVGFGEVRPPSVAGKWFSILLMFLGVGMMLFLLGAVAEQAVRRLTDPKLLRRQQERILARMKDHVIVCGYGMMGQAVCQELLDAGKQVLIIDTNEELLVQAEQTELRTLLGDAADEDILNRAGLDRAEALISVMDSDAQNMFVLVSAREMAPDLPIIVRVSSEAVGRKMKHAGATAVIDPHRLGGRRIAGLLVAPHLSNFLNYDLRGAPSDDEGSFRLREWPVPPEQAGKTVSELHQHSEVLPVAIWRDNEPLLALPETPLAKGDVVLLAGEGGTLGQLEYSRQPIQDQAEEEAQT